MKKLLSILLAMAMVLAMVPLGAIPVFAATSGTTGDCQWVLQGTKLTIFGEGRMGDYKTTGPWGSSITSVLIGEGVTTVGEYAFYYCRALTSVVISNSVIDIGEKAFYYCKNLLSITIGESLSSVSGRYAFQHCESLKEVRISNIHAWCNVDFAYDFSTPFCYGADLYLNQEIVANLIIPESVESVGSYAFNGCTSIVTVTIEDGVTAIGAQAFASCSSLKTIRIPKSVLSIGSHTFMNCISLISIEIPEGVDSIKALTFSGCSSLGSITIPKRINNIGLMAFDECDSLNTVYYYGTQQEKEYIGVDKWNDSILNASWHYFDHLYDSNCNACGSVREVPDIVVGDTDADGKVTITDVVLLQQYLNGWNVEVYTPACDMNGDGKLNNQDLVLLIRKLNGWDM